MVYKVGNRLGFAPVKHPWTPDKQQVFENTEKKILEKIKKMSPEEFKKRFTILKKENHLSKEGIYYEDSYLMESVFVFEYINKTQLIKKIRIKLATLEEFFDPCIPQGINYGIYILKNSDGVYWVFVQTNLTLPAHRLVKNCFITNFFTEFPEHTLKNL